VQRRAFGTADDVFSYSEQARRLTAGVEFITAPTGHDEIAQGKAKRRPGYWLLVTEDDFDKEAGVAKVMVEW